MRIRLLQLIVLIWPLSVLMLAQTGGGVQAGEVRFHVVRSVSGSKGSQQGGRYVIEDPRTTFYVPEDKQVIVYFEWEGPLGKHHLEGYWKNPEGKVVVISDFNYENHEKRFGGFWELNLTETVPTGVWSVETHVDGEFAGSHSFQIVSASKPAGSVEEAPKYLTPSQIYAEALASSVTIDKYGADGQKLSTGSGFLLSDGVVATAFRVIDGATLVRVHGPSGQEIQIREALLWNRWQDWALLPVAGLTMPPLIRAKENSGAIGDRCFFLNVGENGARTIVDLDITGINTYPNAGTRFSLSNLVDDEATGSPLLNEYGQVIGIVGTGTVPGSSSIGGRFGRFSSGWAGKENVRTVALPINAVPGSWPDATPVSFAALLQRGQFVPPLAGGDIVSQGSLSRDIDKRGGNSPMPIGQQYQFSHRDRHMTVFVMWNARQKRNTIATLRLYDLNNGLLMESKPDKLTLRPSNMFSSTDWQLAIDKVPVGTYRLDVLLDGQPVWRTLFAVTE